MKKSISLAVVGATGLVGSKFLEVLRERNVPISELVLFASERSVGKTITYDGKDYEVHVLSEKEIKKHPVEYALFSAGAEVSLKFAPIFAALGTIVIDNSSAWRMDPSVPLVVPEVNPGDAFIHANIIANPNCSTIQAVVAIKPLHDKYKIKRMVISTYQAVSGAGIKGIDDLESKAETGHTKKFPYQIIGNVLPHIDIFMPSGNTKEEEKIILETRKILHEPNMRVSSTAVRVPVLNSHSESINLEFELPFEVKDVFNILKKAPGVILYDDVKVLKYPMPLLSSGHDEVYVGRIRRDESVTNGLNMFVVADNIRKGAASNAIQILELLIK